MLAAGAPDEIAFMADEAVESIAELKPVEYTAKHYALYLQKVLQKTAQLNKGKAHFYPKSSLVMYLFSLSLTLIVSVL